MRKNNLYYALIIKYGTIAEAAKALGTSTKTLECRTTGKINVPLRFMHKAIAALGIEGNCETIKHVFELPF